MLLHVVVALLVGGVVGPTVAAQHADAPATCAASTSSADLSAFFHSGQSGLIGGGYPHAYPLPDGRTLWMFQDSFLGDSDATTLSGARLAHNTAMLQTGLCFAPLHHGWGQQPRSYLGASLEVPLHRWFWPLDGAIGADGHFHLFVAEFINPNGTGAAIGATPIAVWHATLRVSDLAVLSFTRAPDGGARPLYGSSIVSDDTWSYLYGNCYRQFTHPGYVGAADLSCNLDTYVARVPRGRFDLMPTYWNGSAWVSHRKNAAVIHHDGLIASSLQVRQLADGRYVGASKLDDWMGSTMSMYVADRPTGPFVEYTDVHLRTRCGSQCTTYSTSFTPWHEADGALELAISNYTWSFHVANINPWLYRPSLVAVPLPPPRLCSAIRWYQRFYVARQCTSN